MSNFKSFVLYNKSFSDSNRNLFNSTRHILEYSRVLNALNPEPQDKILEIGCNGGEFLRKLAPLCGSVIGIDVNEHVVSSCGADNVKLMDAESLDFPDGCFDKIVSMHTIEHIPGISRALKEMERVIRPNGRIVLTYPFEPLRGVAALRTACIAYRNPLMCRKLHLRKLNRGRMLKLLQGTSLKIVSHRMIFVPWPVYITVIRKGQAAGASSSSNSLKSAARPS